jgi:hypothetical protein
MRTLLHIFFTLMVAHGLVTFLIQVLFYGRLRKKHQSVWEALKKPGIITCVSSCRAVIWFLWFRNYRQLADHETVRMAEVFRNCLVLYLILLAATVIMFLFFIGTKLLSGA